ncbi:MAG: extracellular solute-binding protein [Protaetiibacter sp.]
MAVLPAAALIVSLAGCASGTGDESVEGAKVTVWLQTGGTLEATKSFLESWSESNSYGIDVEVVENAADSYAETLGLALKTGKGPDVFEATGTEELIEAGYLLGLKDLVSEETQEAYGDVLVGPNPVATADDFYAIPLSTNTIRLAYNKDLFEEAGLDPENPPTTLSEVEEACAAIVDSTDAYCYGLPLKWSSWASWQADPIVQNTDATLSIPAAFNRSTEEFEFDRFVPLVQFYRDLYENEWLYPGATSLDNDTMRAAFANGEVGMFVSAAWDVATVNDQFGATIDWGAAAVPVPDGETSVRSIMNIGKPFGVNAATSNATAAAIVLEQIAGATLGEQLAESGAIFPLRTDVAAAIDPATMSAPYADYVISSTDVQRQTSPVLELELQGDTYDQVIAQLIIGDGDIASALAEVEERYNAAWESAVDSGLVDESQFVY